MDPKSLDGKPPVFDALKPEFGASLTSWIQKDMLRAKKAKEERERRQAEAKDDKKK